MEQTIDMNNDNQYGSEDEFEQSEDDEEVINISDRNNRYHSSRRMVGDKSGKIQRIY